jgi:ABC-2 type transport system permease protein
MRPALHAEWTKLRTSPTTPALLLAVVAGTVGVSALAATCSGVSCPADLPKLSLTGVQLGQAVVAVLAVLVMGDEYGSGMAATTLTAVPRRSRVLAAKTVVVAAVVAGAAAVAVTGSLLVGRWQLPAHDLAYRPALGSVLYLVLVALLSLGAATAVRDSAAAIGVVLALQYAAPILVTVVSDPTWAERLQQVSPMTAGLAVQAAAGDAAIGPWKGLGVLALWAAGALLIGGAVLVRRDA